MTVDRTYNTKAVYINSVIPKTHPRKASLEVRHKLIEGFEKGLVAQAGLIAQGRGEAFDYLIGEKTTKEARKAEEAAIALLLSAKRPAISVNGNAAALCAREIVKLAKKVNAKIEVNLFYRTAEREKKIASFLKKHGAKKVYGLEKKHKIKNLSSERANVDDALWQADVVLVMLEDGDRTEALKKAGKKVIAIDLNPMSRTAQKADITIVDNLVRAIPEMAKNAGKLKKASNGKLMTKIRSFNNKKNLHLMEKLIRKKL